MTKLIMTMAFILTFSFSAMASVTLDEAKKIVVETIENETFLQNREAPAESRYILISAESFDVNSIKCKNDSKSASIFCVISAKEAAKEQYKVSGLYFVFDPKVTTSIVSGVGTIPANSEELILNF